MSRQSCTSCLCRPWNRRHHTAKARGVLRAVLAAFLLCTAIPAAATPLPCRQPQLASAGDAVYLACGEANTIFVSSSRDGGRTLRDADDGRQGPGTVARQSPRAARGGCRRLRHRHRDRRNARRRQGRRPDGLAIDRWRPNVEPGGEGERRRRRRAGRAPRDGSARLDGGHGVAGPARERHRSSTRRSRAMPVARGAGTSSSTNRPRAPSASAATRRWQSPRPARSS